MNKINKNKKKKGKNGKDRKHKYDTMMCENERETRN